MNHYQSVFSAVQTGETLIIDGATRTELQRRKVPMEKHAWCALASQSHPDVLKTIHEDYIRAGARIITANTFASTREILEPLGLGEKFVDLNKRSIEIAVEARENCPSEQPVLVAGSISHNRPGRIHQWLPEYSDYRKFEDDCAEMADIHREAGCDLILAEMMGHPKFASCVIRGAKSSGLPVWVGLSARGHGDGSLVTFTNDLMPFRDIVESIVDEGGDVMGIMHTHAELTLPALELLKTHWSGQLLTYPDATPYRKSGNDDVNIDQIPSESEFVEHCVSWHDQGVRVLGGCCGISVTQIAALSARLLRQ